MSADNGIYIARFADGYRVGYAQAIENVQYDGINSDIARAYQQLIFGGSDVYTEDEAWNTARLHADDVGYLEYGICLLPHDFGECPTYTKEELNKILDV